MKRSNKRRFRPILSSKDATELLPLLDEGIARLERLKEEGVTDEEAKELACRLFRLERLSSRISRSLAKNPEAGREPEFIHSVWAVSFPDSPVSTKESKEDIT